ncbi:hypothetical protein KP509_05G068700 [Ceratopteris richardii]|nr:hypothetical protein KP509_05G068700 [Ceratopteris richardii]
MLAESACKLHVVVATSLIKMYGSYGEIRLARQVFDQVDEHDTISWSAMIATYAEHGYEKMSVHLFQQLQKEMIKLDPVALTVVLGACATISALAWGRIIHYSIIASALEADLMVGNALLDMYAKCGNLEDGLLVFEQMPFHDVVSWTAMISAYNQAGYAHKALQLLAEMQDDMVMPNAVTFVNILATCSHEGMVEEGVFYFCFLLHKFAITPTLQHYGCLVDLFVRAGRLEEGEILINNTEAYDSVVAWQALLGACKIHFDVDCGIRSAERIIDFNPELSAPYLALSDFYGEKEFCVC